jgi:putative ATP-binding cassette transporter
MLDKVQRWDRELSLDEQQRLAIGRALLHKPDWIINDEAMSEFDDDNRKLSKSLFENELSGTSLVTIGKRSENGGLYHRTLHLRLAPFEPGDAMGTDETGRR